MCNGRPSIRNKRITVHTILEFLSKGDSFDDVLAQYPTLDREDIYACLEFASDLVENSYVIEPASA